MPSAVTPAASPKPLGRPSIDDLIASNAQLLSAQLTTLMSRLFPPQSQKTLRRFSSGEVARIVGITDGYLRQMALAGELEEPEKRGGGPSPLHFGATPRCAGASGARKAVLFPEAERRSPRLQIA